MRCPSCRRARCEVDPERTEGVGGERGLRAQLQQARPSTRPCCARSLHAGREGEKEERGLWRRSGRRRKGAQVSRVWSLHLHQGEHTFDSLFFNGWGRGGCAWDRRGEGSSCRRIGASSAARGRVRALSGSIGVALVRSRRRCRRVCTAALRRVRVWLWGGVECSDRSCAVSALRAEERLLLRHGAALCARTLRVCCCR